MLYPVGDGTRESFNSQWYIAYGFGEKATYGYHEGLDINLKTGGDSDLGEKIIAISDYTREYYHYKSHPESGFGIHTVYKIVGPWGSRWVHCAHQQSNPEIASSGKQGDVIGRIGKSGRPRLQLPAHLHFSIFKVDPATLPNGIDTIARDVNQLNSWWVDPLAFIEKYYGGAMPSNELETCLKDRQKFWDERDDLLRALGAGSVEEGKATIAGYKSRMTDLANQLGAAQAEAENRKEQVSRVELQLLAKDREMKLLDTELNKANDLVEKFARDKGLLAIELAQTKEMLETVKQQQQQGDVTLTFSDLFKLIMNQKITIRRKS